MQVNVKGMPTENPEAFKEGYNVAIGALYCKPVIPPVKCNWAAV